MAPGEGLARHFHSGARLPGCDDVEPPPGVSPFRPERHHRTGDLAGKVRRIVLEIDGSVGPVILASRMDRSRIFEAAQIFGIRFRRDRLRNQAGETASQEELGAVANECFR